MTLFRCVIYTFRVKALIHKQLLEKKKKIDVEVNSTKQIPLVCKPLKS